MIGLPATPLEAVSAGLTLAFAGVVVWVLARPFLLTGAVQSEDFAESEQSVRNGHRERALGLLEDVEEDFRAQKLSEVEYRAHKTQLINEIASLDSAAKRNR